MPEVAAGEVGCIDVSGNGDVFHVVFEDFDSATDIREWYIDMTVEAPRAG